MSRDAPAWRLVVGGAELATLCDPEPFDMFWVSLRILPLREPADACLRDDAFWLGDAWQLVEAGSGRIEPHAIASSHGLVGDGRRVLIRGLSRP